jgi:uncharacterized protein YicC (UPF0701 family)
VVEERVLRYRADVLQACRVELAKLLAERFDLNREIERLQRAIATLERDLRERGDYGNRW